MTIKSKPEKNIELLDKKFVDDIRNLVDEGRRNVVLFLNREMTLLYWGIGKRIQEEILKFERGEYGEKIMETLAQQLTSEYGKGFSRRNLTYMIQFCTSFPNPAIVQTLSA